MGFFDWLFGDSDSGTTQTTSPPAWLESAGKNVVTQAQTLASQPYQPYPGPRLAPLTPQFGQAGQLFSQGSSPLTQSDFQNYMNPYITNVLDVTSRELQRQHGIGETMEDYQATQAGAFGGSRHGIVDAESDRNYAMAQKDLYSQGYASAFDRAGALAQADRNRMLQGGQNTMGLGAYLQQYGQTALDIPYQDWQRQQAYPYSQLSYMSDILRGVPSSQQTMVKQPDQGAFQSILGFGSSLASLFD